MQQLTTFLSKHPWVWQLSLVFAVWRAVMFGIGVVAPIFLSYEPSFPYSDVIFLPYNLPQWLYSWANFDGVHYLTLIERGYLAVNYIQAFFPVFPLLVMGLNQVHNSSLVNGLLVSNIMAIVAVLFWFNLLKTTYSVKHAWLGTWILLLFPAAFFLGAFYTESLFLALVLGSFWAARRQQWLVTGILVAVASATRVIGVFLIPALAVEWLLQYHDTHHSWPKVSLRLLKQNFRVVLGLGIGLTGLLGYMYYLNLHFGDPLYFFHVQSDFGAGRQESLVLFPQVVWRYLKILVTARPFDLKYLAYTQEFTAAIGGLGLLILAMIKKVRWSYLVFALAAFILPTLTGTFSSLSRYLLVCFPIFMVLTESLHKHRRLMIGYLVLSGLLLVINVMLFIQGYWVA